MLAATTAALALLTLSHATPFSVRSAARSNPFLPTWGTTVITPTTAIALDRSNSHCAAHSSAGQFGTARLPAASVHAALPSISRQADVLDRRAGWTVWIDWGGICRHAPEVVSHADILDIFVVAPDQGIYHRNRNGEVYSDWEALGGHFISAPSAVHHDSGKLHVVALGRDNHIWQAEHYNGKWGAFEDTCIETYKTPGIAAYLEDRYFIFAVSITNRVYYNQYHYGTSEGWKVAGDMEFSSAPVGVSLKETNPSFNYLVGNDLHGIVQFTSFQNGWWSQQWHSLDKYAMDAPAVSRRAGGFDIAIRDADSEVWVNSYSTEGDVWKGWHALGGRDSIGRPTIAASSEGVIYVYAVFSNHELNYRAKYPDAEWTEWIKLGNYVVTEASADERDGKYMDVWAVDYLHRLSHKTTLM